MIEENNLHNTGTSWKGQLKELLQNKKILYAALAGILVFSFLIWLIIRFSFSGHNGSSPLEAIPSDAAMILEVKQPAELWSDLSVNSGVWRELSNMEPFNKINEDLFFLDSLFKTDPCAEDLLTDHALYISFHPMADNSSGFLYLTSLTGNCKKSSVEDLIQHAAKNKATFTEKSFMGAGIIEVAIPGKKDKLSYTVSRDVFICSFQPVLLESAIKQQRSGTPVSKEDGFMKVAETAGKKVNANLYINFKFFPRFASVLASSEYMKNIADLAGFSDWSALDVSVKNDAIMLNGFTHAADSVSDFLSVFSGQDPHEMSMLDIIPSSTASFVYFGFSDFDSWYKKYLLYLSKKGKLNAYEAAITKQNTEYKTDIRKNINTWVGKEMALVITEPSDSDIASNMYAVIKADNITNALTLLSPQSKELGQKEPAAKTVKKNSKSKKKKTKEKETKKPDKPVEVKSNKIYEYKVPGVLPALFGKLFGEMTGKYYTVIDDYVIFANSSKALTSLIKDYSDERTLKDNNGYIAFSKNISNESNLYLYCNIKRSLGIFLKYANRNAYDYIGNNFTLFKNFEAFGFQLKSSGKLFYNNICLKTSTSSVEESSALWTYKLDTAISIRPYVVSDIKDRSKKIIAFDCASNMYLVDKDGSLLWKIQLKEKPLSDVFVIDYFKNGKTEYMFNTPSYIYCIDKDGKNVEDFPKHLSEISTGPMNVVDYANDKDYRLIIPCRNKIFNFTKDGTESKGWTIAKTKNIIYREVTHLKFNGTDYLVASDKDGNMVIADRKGIEKIILKSVLKVSDYAEFYSVKAGKKVKASILTTDDSGNLVNISSSGEVTKTFIAKFSSQHYFLYEDVNNDKSKEYIFVDNNKLNIYDNGLKEICSYTLPSGVSAAPEYYKGSDDKGAIGLVSSKINKIYLVKQDGALSDGFPLCGSTPFSIVSMNNDGSSNLIVGSGRTIYNYVFE